MLGPPEGSRAQGYPPMRVLRLQVNGDLHEVAAPDHWSLLEVLRYRLGLTGSKQGCDKGDCGACTVLADGQPILACLRLAAVSEREAITTIEGLWPAHLARGGCGPDPIQDAFDRCGALQCGFCQPGMMLSARALLDREPQPTREQIREALAGNLCRCTGYTQILQAVELAVAEAAGATPTSPSWAPGENPWVRPAPTGAPSGAAAGAAAGARPAGPERRSADRSRPESSEGERR
jgi:aerobic-type carbon monoxide dehydrogenase small subunit (CoxS/CutS family)